MKIRSLLFCAESSHAGDAALASVASPPQAGEMSGSSFMSSDAAATSKRDDYITWDDYFVAVSFLSAMRSKGQCCYPRCVSVQFTLEPQFACRSINAGGGMHCVPRQAHCRHWVQRLPSGLL